jgi:hypothetical protein
VLNARLREVDGMSDHNGKRIETRPVGAYGLWSATANGRFLAGGFSAEVAERRARRVLEAGGPPNHAHGDPLRRHLPLCPVVEVLDLGRGVLIHPDRLPALAHCLPDMARCAEAVRRRFVSTWVRHLAESSYSHGANERIAGELTRILSEARAVEWLHWRRNDALDGLRCPLTDVWFREQVRTDCCGIVIALDAAVMTETGGVFCVKCWERRP